jgi:hypothetical protein
MHARKLSHAPGTKVEFIIENASTTMPALKSRNLAVNQAQTDRHMVKQEIDINKDLMMLNRRNQHGEESDHDSIKIDHKGFQVEASDMSSIGTFHPNKTARVINMKNIEKQKFGFENIQKLQERSSVI